MRTPVGTARHHSAWSGLPRLPETQIQTLGSFCKIAIIGSHPPCINANEHGGRTARLDPRVVSSAEEISLARSCEFFLLMVVMRGRPQPEPAAQLAQPGRPQG